jgi:Fe-S-cluster-containing dehydrogenase component
MLSINEDGCWGCKTCEVACKQEQNIPVGIKLISVAENGAGMNSNRKDFHFQVTVCRHCDDPPCVEACPEGAIVRREDGIVVLDSLKCEGCGLCLESCPYDAIAMDEERGIAQKCNLCYNRVDNGLIPACADNVCPAHCIHFESV